MQQFTRYLPSGRFRYIFGGTVLLMLAYLGENVFFWGGEALAKGFNNYLSPILGIFAALFGMALWNEVSWEKNANRIWGSVALGLSLWTLAEMIWAFYTFVQQEIPYPSAADFLWLAGYPVLFAALLWRYRGLRVRASLTQVILVGLFTLFSALYLLFLLFWPLVQSWLGEFTASLILALAYPLLDLPLISLSIMIGLALGEGKFGAPWGWLAVSFFFRLLSDIGFAYAIWVNGYYPDGHLNDLSVFIDYTYNISYGFVFLGLYLQQTLARTAGRDLPPEQNFSDRVHYANCLLFTDPQDTLVAVSANFLRLLGLQNDASLLGQPIWLTLQMSAEAFENLRQTAQKESLVKEWRHTISLREGQTQRMTLSAAAAFSDRHEFTGLNLLARVIVSEEEAPSLELEAEQRDLAASLLGLLGLEGSAQQQELKAYFYAEFKLLYHLVLESNGSAFATTLLKILRLTSDQHNWNIELTGEEALLPRGRQELRPEELKLLLDTLRDYVEKVVGPDVLSNQLQRMAAQLSPNVLETARKQGLTLEV